MQESGPTALSNFKSTLNILPIHHKSLKRRERKIGKVVEKAAKESCIEKAKLERQFSSPDAGEDEIVDVGIGYDGAWQKRGRAHNSLTGVGHAIGMNSNSVVGYSTRNKKCVSCDVAKRDGRDPTPHDCRVNWSKSSKAMEPDVAAELAKEAPKCGIRFATVVGDDDSSSIKKLREELNSDIVKWSDITHAKLSVGGHLHDLNKNHNELSREHH